MKYEAPTKLLTWIVEANINQTSIINPKAVTQKNERWDAVSEQTIECTEFNRWCANSKWKIVYRRQNWESLEIITKREIGRLSSFLLDGWENLNIYFLPLIELCFRFGSIRIWSTINIQRHIIWHILRIYSVGRWHTTKQGLCTFWLIKIHGYPWQFPFKIHDFLGKKTENFPWPTSRRMSGPKTFLMDMNDKAR